MSGRWWPSPAAPHRPTAATLIPASPRQVRAWLADGDTLLVDIREAEEHAALAIPEATSVPLSRFPDRLDLDPAIRRVVFHCRSGHRTLAAAARLHSSTALPCYALAGGLQAWFAAELS